MTARGVTSLGMSEQELRESLAGELDLAFRAEQNTATIHAIAHSVARIIELDHLRIAEQLAQAGVHLEEPGKGAAADQDGLDALFLFIRTSSRSTRCEQLRRFLVALSAGDAGEDRFAPGGSRLDR